MLAQMLQCSNAQMLKQPTLVQVGWGYAQAARPGSQGASTTYNPASDTSFVQQARFCFFLSFFLSLFVCLFLFFGRWFSPFNCVSVSVVLVLCLTVLHCIFEVKLLDLGVVLVWFGWNARTH